MADEETYALGTVPIANISCALLRINGGGDTCYAVPVLIWSFTGTVIIFPV